MSLMLPTPGSSFYIPTLLRTLLANPALEGWMFDTDLFSLLFLALIVRRGGVCVNVGSREGPVSLPAEDVERVVHVVRGISESIFGLDTHRVYLSSDTMPTRLHSLVLDRRKHERDDHSTPHDRTSSRGNQPTTPISPMSYGSGSGISTRYHSAESVPSAEYRAMPDTIARLAPVIGSDAGGTNANPENTEEGEKEDLDWPETLIVTGLEDCDTLVQSKLMALVKSSARERPDRQAMIVVWVRPEAAGDRTPPWLADNYVLSQTVPSDEIEIENPPSLERQALVPPSYIRNIAALIPYTHIHPPLTQHLNNLISATSTHPNLHSVLTSRFFITLPILVKAYRLLTTPFKLPPDWQENLARLARPEVEDEERFGLGGGKGGVDGWARKAGEEPNLLELGAGGETWFVGPDDVRGVWMPAIRHRVKWRELSENVMWVMNSNAEGLLQDKGVSEKRREKRAGRRRRQVDEILEDMLEML